jgi:uncharacterized protein YlxW (UPF0749 family)
LILALLLWLVRDISCRDLKIQVHESLAPLLRGIGLTVVLLGTVLAAIQTKENGTSKHQARAAESSARPDELNSTNDLQNKSLTQLTQEIEGLRETVQQETTVEEVLVNPWFGSLGTLGSAITAGSFYVEWICKRPRRVIQNPSPPG